MNVQPATAEVARSLADGRATIVWTRLVADLETPVSAMLKLAAGKPYSFLLESVEGGAVRGRYSGIGFAPDLVWRCRDGRAEINRHALVDPHAFVASDLPPLESLARLIRDCRMDVPAELPPMSAGLFGYMSYDMVRLMERLPDSNPDPLDIPEAVYMRPTVICVFDNVGDTLTVMTPVWPDPGVAPEAACAAATARLQRVVDALGRPLPAGYRADRAPAPAATPVANMTQAQFEANVTRAREYIAAGDAFQIVPSQRFSVPLQASSFALYRALRRLNPSPFLFHLELDGFALVGSSPEILVRLRGDTVTIRPLAGTRPRGATAAEDEALAAELLADPKERAEHLMLLDLGRNDVGRVSEIGSVRVTEQFAIERYSHVMHIVSNVEGRLKPGLEAIDALVAGFPAGTVTGAPKIRAMEIIDELEPARRSFYAGTVGYFGANGDMDTCIALRTALVKDGTMYAQAGSGVVADSDPTAEWQESRNKARALLRAAEEAGRYAGPEADDAVPGVRRPAASH
ncbi:MAG: anthranilate synthase component I [Alphaproteobacteria bacterium]